MNISIKVEPLIGTDVKAVIEDMVIMAIRLDCAIEADLNEVYIYVTPKSNAAHAHTDYLYKLKNNVKY